MNTKEEEDPLDQNINQTIQDQELLLRDYGRKTNVIEHQPIVVGFTNPDGSTKVIRRPEGKVVLVYPTPQQIEQYKKEYEELTKKLEGQSQ
jgi:hypothetical protein